MHACTCAHFVYIHPPLLFVPHAADGAEMDDAAFAVLASLSAPKIYVRERVVEPLPVPVHVEATPKQDELDWELVSEGMTMCRQFQRMPWHCARSHR
jgi:hypothetical protein